MTPQSNEPNEPQADKPPRIPLVQQYATAQTHLATLRAQFAILQRGRAQLIAALDDATRRHDAVAQARVLHGCAEANARIATISADLASFQAVYAAWQASLPEPERTRQQHTRDAARFAPPTVPTTAHARLESSGAKGGA
jgi:hypothetical protein